MSCIQIHSHFKRFELVDRVADALSVGVLGGRVTTMGIPEVCSQVRKGVRFNDEDYWYLVGVL